MKKSPYLFVLLLLLSVSIISFLQIEEVTAEPKTIVVPDDYPSIQQAIDSALAGDTVYVKSGTYHENLVVNKSLSLIGEDRDTTIVDGDPSEGFRIPIQIRCDNVSVSGFKLLYGWVGITVGEVKSCSISGNRIAGGTNGIKLVHTSDSNITENIFERIGLSSAIQLSYATNNLIKGNYICSCVEGIQIWLGSKNNTVTENTITNCSEHALGFQYSDKNIVSINNISDSGVGTSIYVSNLNVISHNNYVDNAVQFASDSNESYAMTFGYNVSVNTINKNYWSDYNGTDNNGDGIGDTPYVVNENNQDNYPLMELYTIPENPTLPTLPYAPFDLFPEPGSIDIPLDTNISISISRPPSIVNMSISPEVAVKERVDEVIDFSGRYTFILSELLEPNTTYTVTMVFGDEGAPEGFAPTSTKTWTFTTVAEKGMGFPIVETTLALSAIVVAFVVLYYSRRKLKL